MSKLVPSTDIIKCYNTTNQFIQMQTLPQHLYVSCITETVAQGGTRIYFNRAHNTHTCNSSGWRIPSSPMLQYLFALVNSHKYLKAYTKPKLSWSSWFYYSCFFSGSSFGYHVCGCIYSYASVNDAKHISGGSILIRWRPPTWSRTEWNGRDREWDGTVVGWRFRVIREN